MGINWTRCRRDFKRCQAFIYLRLSIKAPQRDRVWWKHLLHSWIIQWRTLWVRWSRQRELLNKRRVRSSLNSRMLSPPIKIPPISTRILKSPASVKCNKQMNTNTSLSLKNLINRRLYKLQIIDILWNYLCVYLVDDLPILFDIVSEFI